MTRSKMTVTVSPSPTVGVTVTVGKILALVEMFRGKIVDIGQKFVMVELADTEDKIEAFIEACRQYGIKNMVRTGTVAMSRFDRPEVVDNQ